MYRVISDDYFGNAQSALIRAVGALLRVEPAPGAGPMASAVGVTAQDERDAMARLARLNGPGELRAAILALLATPDSRREHLAWQEATAGLGNARTVREDTATLGPASRLPWLELLLGRVAAAPLADRQQLMAAARRLMSADGQIRPIDRLRWLLMRQRLGDAPAGSRTAATFTDLARSGTVRPACKRRARRSGTSPSR